LVRINQGDRLGWLQLTNGQNEVLLVTNNGMAIRFSEEEVRPMGLVAAGVMGIRLQGDDLVAGMELLPKQGDVFMITDAGRARRVETNQFPKQGRYGQGVVAWKLAAREKIIGMTIGKGTIRGTVFLKKLLPKVIRLD
jgi:DNA gyrase subunit A